MPRTLSGLVLAALLAVAAPADGLAQVAYGYTIEFEEPDFPFKRPMNARFRPELDPLRAEIAARQEAGLDVTCSLQIYREAHWLVNYTPDAEGAKRRIADLRDSLRTRADQSWALEQSAGDGSWGACYEAWFFRLHASVDPLKELQVRGGTPRYPLAFLEAIDEPEELAAIMAELLTSDIDAGEANRRRELNMVTTAMGQLLFLPGLEKVLPAGYPRQAMAATLRSFMDETWQNQSTGYWGAWYRVDGDLVKTDDLSLTFHVVSYRRGEVQNMRALVDTTFNLRETRYPFGWQDRGTTNNHHSYDVATLLRYGWPYMHPIQHVRASAEISIMLARSLRLTIDGQGRFYTEAYDNIGDAYYFGVSFLDVVGYFDPAKRFWAAGLKFQEAAALRRKLIQNMEALDSADPMILAALRKLRGETDRSEPDVD